MAKEKDNLFSNLPACAVEYIKLVIKKMRWRKKVRGDVQAELIAHFEDALKDCKTDEDKEKIAKELISNFGNPKILATLARRAKKRCLPLWQKMIIKTFQTCSIIIIGLSLYMFWFVSGKPKITFDYVAELNKMVRPANADESQNAAIYYTEAAKKVENIPEDLKEILEKSYYEANEPERKIASEWLAKNQEIFKLISIGNEKPYYWLKYESEANELMAAFLPHLGEYRSLAKILSWRAGLSAEQGNYSQAFEDALIIYKFGKHLKNEPFLVGQLVAIAIENITVENLRQILSRYDIDISELKKLQNDLQEITQDEVFTTNLKTEKFLLYDEVQRCFTEDFLGLSHIYLPRFSEIALGPSEGSEGKDAALTLLALRAAIWDRTNKKETIEKIEELDRYYEKLSAKSPAQIKQENINIEEDFEKIAGNNLFMRVLSPAFAKVIIISFQNKGNVEAIKTIIALTIYKKEYGQYPQTLQQLIDNGYLDKVPIDPYSDRSLVYKKIDNDFTLYSVGPDFDDDNGKTYHKVSGRSSPWPPDSNDGDAVFWPVTNPVE
jgi:dsDNA-binding SOS-regulon protein